MASQVSGIIEQIKIDTTPYSIAASAYGVCETAANEAAKAVEMTGFKLNKGVTIHIKFTNGNTTSYPTLNVESTGAKAIREYGTTLSSTTVPVGGWEAGAIISLTYDGSYWVKETTGDHKHNTQSLVHPAAITGVNDVTYQALINDVRANRLAFLPANQIIIEQTIDGGQTWTSANVSDGVKTGLFSETRNAVYIPKINGEQNTSCGLRITFTAMKYNVPENTPETEKYNYWNSTYVISAERYNQIKNFYFWLSSTNNTIKVVVQRATGGNPNNWNTIFENNNYGMIGWSGNDIITVPQGTFGGGINQTSNFWNWRIILMTSGPGGSDTLATGNLTQSQSIQEIRGYGDTYWTAGNKYAASDHLYSWDYNKNATFPANLTATKFIGPLQGNANTATAANLTSTINAVAYYTNTNGTFGSKASANGALYATETNGELTWGILPIAQGGTGQTTAQNAANVLINGLTTGSSELTANDYVITQYVGGGTTTTTYHRRPANKVINETLVKAALGTVNTTAKKFLKDTGNWVQVDWGDLTGKPTTLSDYGITDTVLKAYNRNQIGTSPNFDNPGVNGFFEIRGASETSGATGTRPFNGWGNFLNLETSVNRMQIAGVNDQWYIRGAQSGNINTTMPTVQWNRIVLNSGTWDISITGSATSCSGNAATATAIQTAGTTAQFYRGDNSWSNTIKQTANTVLEIDANLKIGTARKDLNFDIGNGSGTGINDGYAGGITWGNGTSAYAGIYYQSSGSYGSRLIFATTSSYGNGAYARMIIQNNGRIGIGTLSPDTLLTVNGNAKATKFIGALQGNADTASNINNQLPTLATAIEQNEIKVIDLGNSSPEAGKAQRHAIDFKWYDSHWAIGNLRSGSYPSAGFGFSYSADGTTYSNLAIINTSGNISATSFTGSGASLTDLNGSNISSGTVADEYIASSIARLASPDFTGTPTAPTADAGTNTTQIATTEFVNNTLSYVNAMQFKGTLGTGGTITALPVTHEAGDTYRVITAGTWAGKYCEQGTLIICVKDGTTNTNADWTSVETNEDGAVIGPSSATDGNFILFNGNTGRIIKDSNYSPSSFAVSGHSHTLKIGNKSLSVGTDEQTWNVLDILYDPTNTILQSTSWNITTPGIYAVTNSSHDGDGHPGSTSGQTAPYAYGHLIITRAGNYGAAQIYISHQSSNSKDATRGIRYRSGWNVVSNTETGWQAWATILDDKNFNLYAPKLDGTGASGTWEISITGNANTATKLGTTTIGDKESTFYLNEGTATAGLKVFTLAGGTSIPANADMSSYKTIGNYYGPGDSNARTVTNTPFGAEASNDHLSFTLKVEASLGSGTTYLRQYWRGYNSGVEAERTSTNSGSSWSTWRTKVFKNSNAVTAEGGAYVPVYIQGNGRAIAVSSNKVLTNLESTTEASIYAESPRPGVTGTLGISNGGTGNTTFTQDCIITYTSNSKLESRGLKVTGATNDNIVITPYATNKNLTINANGTGMISITSTTGKLTVSSNYGSLILQGGAANTTTYSALTLGNSTAVTSANQSEGKITLYSASTAAHIIDGESTTANHTHTFPNKTGYIVIGSTDDIGSDTGPVYLSDGELIECANIVQTASFTLTGVSGAGSATIGSDTTISSNTEVVQISVDYTTASYLNSPISWTITNNRIVLSASVTTDESVTGKIYFIKNSA